jgi:DNA repair photolyase
VARDARRIRNRGVVQPCTTVDAWSPEAQEHDLGRRCLEAILSQPDWTVRVLTKNTAVAKDFDLIRRYADRVLVGLTITATPDKTDLMSVVEPHASPINERMAVMKESHNLGLNTYSMFCTLLPGIADVLEQIDSLVQSAVARGARCGRWPFNCDCHQWPAAIQSHHGNPRRFLVSLSRIGWYRSAGMIR